MSLSLNDTNHPSPQDTTQTLLSKILRAILPSFPGGVARSQITGIAVDKGTYAPHFTNGQIVPIAVDQDSGRALIDAQIVPGPTTLAANVQGIDPAGGATTSNPVQCAGIYESTVVPFKVSIDGIQYVAIQDLQFLLDSVATSKVPQGFFKEVVGSVKYLGWSRNPTDPTSGATWLMCRIDKSQPKQKKWASGSYDKIADNYASLTYS